MFTKFIFTILLLACTVSFAQSQGLNSVYSKDGIEVWAAGTSGTVLRSFDAGYYWYGYTIGSQTFYTIFAVNQRVWAGGSSGVIYYSFNGGTAWNSQTLPSSEIRSIFFTDENNGWAAGGEGKIFKTVNGGLNWTIQATPVSSRLNSIKFINSTTGAACGNGGVVLYTNNGGTTWQQSSTPTSRDLLSIEQKVSVIIASSSEGFIIKSTNGGSSWTSIDYKIMTRSEVNSVHMLDVNTFYTCGGGGFIRKSADGGNTFSMQMNPMMANLVSIYFYNSSKGWAVSSKNNAVIWTADGGNTWSLPGGTSVNFSWSLKGGSGGNIGNDLALHPTNKRVVYVACGSSIFRSGDIGETWTQIATLPYSSAHSFYVSYNDTMKMLAAVGSSGGRIVRSTDYGQTWTVTWGPGPLTAFGMPIEMDPNHSDTVFLAPNSSAVLRSTNFGSTWTIYGSSTFTDPCDVVVLPGYSNIVYLGDQSGGGKFWKSTDGGVTWTQTYNAGGSEIPMIGVSSIDPNIVFFTNWGGSGFRRSTDQGLTFTLVSATSSTWGCDVAKDDPTAVAFGLYSSSTNGYISTNGGSSFVTSTIGGSVNYGMLFYDRGNLIAQQSGGIYKLNVTYNVPIITAITQNNNESPKSFRLYGNYPNPFNPVTLIRFDVPERAQNISLQIFDAAGRQVETLVSGNLDAGNYEIEWNASGYPSGVYFYELQAAGFKASKKMVLVK